MDEPSAKLTENSKSPHNTGQNRNLLDYIFFLRPILHPPVWTIVILGYFRQSKQIGSSWILIWLLMLSSGAAGWAYIVNQISDVESDRLNNKLYFLPRNLIDIRTAFFLAGSTLLITLCGSLFLGARLFALYAIGLFLGYLYSGKPFQGKNYPLSGILLNGIAHGFLPFMAGFIGAGNSFDRAIFYSIPYFFAVVAVFIGTTVPDIPGDSKAGKITPGVAFGIRRAALLMAISLMASLLSALILNDIAVLIASLLCLPFYIVSTVKANERSVLLSVKLSILFLSIAAGWFFWPYFILLAALFIATRIYYHRRFGINYPSLT